jgi:hypothetical protein
MIPVDIHNLSVVRQAGVAHLDGLRAVDVFTWMRS